MSDKRHHHNKPKKLTVSYKPPFPDGVLAEPVTNLSLRDDTLNLLLGANVNTIGDVLKRTETEFYKINRFNKKNLFDVKNAVKKRDLFLRPLPAPEAPAATGNAPAGKAPEQNRNNSRPHNDRNERKTKEKEPTYVMTTIPEKPPRPTKTVIKEEPDRYVKINKGGLWGFKDRNSKDMPVPAVYDEVFNFKDDVCCVQKDEKFGFINRQGEEIIPIIYDCATSFSEGYACVYKGENCGYINKNGETVIDFKYDAGTPIIDGECRVKKNGKWGELHIDNPNEVRWII